MNDDDRVGLRRAEARRPLRLRLVPCDDAGAPLYDPGTDHADPADGPGAAPLLEVQTVVDLGVLARERVSCAPLRCTLSTLACARRHVVARTPLTGREGFEETVSRLHLEGSVCRTCEVGAANARRARL